MVSTKNWELVEMPEDKKEQFTTQDEVTVEVTTPLQQPTQVLTTKRKTPIRRFNAVPLEETHGMITEANRFRQD